ncbi:MAG: hypothetical protein ABIV13_04345, partial [Fimbriimonadales bacterium]
CEQVRNEIREMSVETLYTAAADGHLANCASCRSYLQQMRHLSTGLSCLTIPRPVTMQPPVATRGPRRVRVMTLMAATLAMLLVGALAAFVYKTYFIAEDSGGPGTREALFYTFGKDGTKKVKSPQTGQLEPLQSKPSPSNPSRN